jgi:protein gp37
MAKRLRAMALTDIAAGRNPGRKRAYIDAVDDKGRWTGKIVPVPEALGDPLKWRKPQMVFVNSMSDLFHQDVPDRFIEDVFCRMAVCPQHTFQVLTKRADRLLPWYKTMDGGGLGLDGKARDRGKILIAGREWDWPLPNVWIGVSVEDQKQAEERIPGLLRMPAVVRFLSCEPLLGPVDLTQLRCGAEFDGEGAPYYDALAGRSYWGGTGEFGCHGPAVSWVIVGAESGPGARPCQVSWIRSLVGQCADTGTSCFVKQLGAHVIDHDATSGDTFPESQCWPAGTKTDGHRILLRDRKGGEPAEWPPDLRVRRFPGEPAAAPASLFA